MWRLRLVFFLLQQEKNNFHTHKLDRCGAKINMLRCNHGGFPCFSIATHSEIRAFSRLYPLECRAEAEPKRAEASERVSKSKIGVGAIPCFRFELHQTHIPSRIASSSLTQEIRWNAHKPIEIHFDIFSVHVIFNQVSLKLLSLAQKTTIIIALNWFVSIRRTFSLRWIANAAQTHTELHSDDYFHAFDWIVSILFSHWHSIETSMWTFQSHVDRTEMTTSHITKSCELSLLRGWRISAGFRLRFN